MCTRLSCEHASRVLRTRRSGRALSIVRNGERRRRVRARCTRGTATRVDYASSHSSLTLRRRRRRRRPASQPGPAAHTQLSNIRGGLRWPPRSYKACFASVDPSCLTLYWSPSFLHYPPAPRRVIRTYGHIDEEEREGTREREREENTCTLIRSRPTSPVGPRFLLDPRPCVPRSRRLQRGKCQLRCRHKRGGCPRRPCRDVARFATKYANNIFLLSYMAFSV